MKIQQLDNKRSPLKNVEHTKKEALPINLKQQPAVNVTLKYDLKLLAKVMLKYSGVQLHFNINLSSHLTTYLLLSTMQESRFSIQENKR